MSKVGVREFRCKESLVKYYRGGCGVTYPLDVRSSI